MHSSALWLIFHEIWKLQSLNMCRKKFRMGPWDYPFWGFSPYRGRNLTFLFSISFSLTDYIQVVILFTNMSSVVFSFSVKIIHIYFFRSSHLDFWFDSRVWRWMLLMGGSWSQVFFQQLVSYRSAPSHLTKSATHAFFLLDINSAIFIWPAVCCRRR